MTRRNPKPKPAKFRFSVVPRAATTEPPTQVEMPFAEFAKLAARPRIRSVKDGDAWIPATFKPGTSRRAQNVAEVTAWGGDIDTPGVTRRDIERGLNGYTYLVHPTFSSKPGAERWRVILPLAKPVAPTKAPALFETFNKKLGGVLDPACKDPSRLFYLPACPPGGEEHYECFHREGELFDASHLPDAPKDRETAAPVAPAKRVPKRFYEDLKGDGDLRDRWEGSTVGLNDESRSGLDMSLTALLVNREYSDAEIAAILIAYQHGKAADDEKGRKYIARMLRKARADQEVEASAVESEDESAGSEILVRRASDIDARPIRWLWPGRIARGKLSLVAGDPGLGKSQLTCSLAATITRGGKFVDAEQAERANVIILSAEDDAADTIRPRLEAAGADLERVFIVDAVSIPRKEGDPIERQFNLSEDRDRLRRLLERIGDVALIVIDPVSAYLGNVDSHRNSEVRGLLAPLSSLAAAYEVAVVCVTHLNKGDGKDAMQRITGSLAFAAAARAAYLVVRDGNAPERRLFLPLKNNIGNDQSGLAFSVEGHQLRGGVGTSRVQWERSAVATTANEALSALAGEETSGALRDAQEFLSRTLARGAVAAKQIENDARGAGHSIGTVRRAKVALGIEAIKTPGKQGEWMWRFPPKRRPADG